MRTFERYRGASRTWLAGILYLLWCSGICAIPARSQDALPPSTLGVYQSLVAGAVDRALAQLAHPESLAATVAVEPAGTYWFIEEGIAQELRRHGVSPVPSSGQWQLECAVKEARVSYRNVRREGLLGARLVDRTAVLSVWLRIGDRAQGKFLYDQEVRSECTDTIEVSAVERVEHPGVAATHGLMPSEGFFSSWLEPLILVGAIGVAILLLFTTRS